MQHKAIVEGLRARGIIVFDMPEPGDILCYGQLAPPDIWTRIWMTMEIKSDKKISGYKPELTKSQQRRADQGAAIPQRQAEISADQSGRGARKADRGDGRNPSRAWQGHSLGR